MTNHPNRSLPPLAKALRAWREREGLTVTQAAEARGISERVWEDWEQRAKSPRTNLATLAGELLLEEMAR